MQGNLHVPFLGGWVGAILPGYPAEGETGCKAPRPVLTQLPRFRFRVALSRGEGWNTNTERDSNGCSNQAQQQHDPDHVGSCRPAIVRPVISAAQDVAERNPGKVGASQKPHDAPGRRAAH